jgi:putative selenate reductase
VPGETIFDMSVGYDLEGIRSKPVRAFLDGMLDCRATVDRLRPELPESMRDVTIGPCLSNTLTLSTFHGCPPSEIESICEWLLEELGLHVIVKLNPLLLGPKDLRQRLHTDLGYRDLSVPDKAFEEDTRWEQMEGFVQRLGQRADRLGLGFGVKFTNTLVVQNQRDFFPATEETMYLSGQPLHVLAMELVGRFRERFEDRYPISFSAGIDRRNFADSVALGLTPVTVCTDLLRPGGYARGKGYLDELEGRMSKVGARNIDEFVLLARGQGEQTLSSVTPMSHAADQVQCEQFLATTRADGEGKDQEGALPRGDSLNAWRSAAVLQNTRDYVHELIQDPRYHQDANLKLPRKIGSQLELLDCITCDKCVPVCPNDANFTFVLEPASIPKRKATLENGQWTITVDGTLEIEQRHQIACFTDFCNECGNCDVFCPEDGGPYKIKPRFFGDIEELRQNPTLDGFCYERLAGIDRLQARIGGRDFILKRGASRIEFMGVKFSIHFDEGRLQETIEGKAAESIDLVYYDLLALILDAVCGPDSHEYPALHARAGSESSE